MSYQNYFSQALKNIYGKKQQQGYGMHQQRGYQPRQGYGGFAGLETPYPDIPPLPDTGQPQQSGYPHFGQIPQGPTQPQTSPISEALTSSPWADIMQNMPTSWDWEGGESSPYGIRAPWLGYSWHYDESGRIVPNNPNHPMAPWNMAGSTQTYEGWLETQQPSPLFNKGVR